MKKRPRQADVAALAKVSPAIVSRVINGQADQDLRIGENTRQRVWDAVRELGYVVNPIARKLAGNQNRLLGVFTYEPDFPIEHNFYYRFLIGIEREAQVQDYDLLLFTRAYSPDGRRAIYKDGVNSLQVADGAVLLGANEDREELARLVQGEYPFVFVGRREITGGEISYATADYSEATQKVVAFIHSKGHRKMVYLGTPTRNEAHQDRESGYRLGHQQLGMPIDEHLIYRCATSNITPELLQGYLTEGVTAFITENSAHAHALLEASKQLGKHIPDDLSLAALGDPFDETEVIPDVTGFLTPCQEMGREAVRLLIKKLQSDDPSLVYRTTLPCTFIEGKTVAGPPIT